MRSTRSAPALLAVILAACYSPTVQLGAPCSAATDICPASQTCQLSGGSYACTSATGDAPTPDATNYDDAQSDAGFDASLATIAVVQATASDSTASVNSLALANPVQQGDAIIVCFSFSSEHSEFVSLTDTLGNAYAVVAGPVPSNGFDHYVAIAANSPAGSDTVTVTLGPLIESDWDLLALEYTGLALTNPFDATAYSSGTGTAMTSGSAATSSPHELLLGYGHATGPTVGSGYTERDSGNDNLVEDQVVFTTGSYAATATATSGIWTLILATFAGG